MELEKKLLVILSRTSLLAILSPTITSIEIGRNCSEVGIRSRIKDRHTEYGI